MLGITFLKKPALAGLMICATAWLTGCGDKAPHSSADTAQIQKGAELFITCTACHRSSGSTDILVGPPLKGIVGRKAGSIEGFKYSKALASANLVWTEENIAKLLRDPAGFVPGMNMALSPIQDEQDIAALVAFLKTLR